MRLILPALLVVAFLGFAACDSLDNIDLIANVTDQPVNLGANEGNVSVTANTTTVSTSTVNNNLDVDEIEELQQIELLPDYFDFAKSTAAGKTDGTQDTGTLTVLVSFGLAPSGPLFPLPPVTLTIVDNQVTDVQPRSISLLGGTYNINQIQGIIDSLPPAQRPNMAALGNLTIDQAGAAIATALSNNTFLFSIIVQSNGISGNLKIKQFSIDARILEEND